MSFYSEKTAELSRIRSHVALGYFVSFIAWFAAGLAGVSLDFNFKEAGSFWSYSSIGILIVIGASLLKFQVAPIKKIDVIGLLLITLTVSTVLLWNLALAIQDGAIAGQVFGMATIRSFLVGMSLALALIGLERGREIFLITGSMATMCLSILGILQVANGWCHMNNVCPLVIQHLEFWHKPFGLLLFRASGGLIDPNVYAALICMGLGANLIIMRQVTGLKRFGSLIICLVQIIAILLSGSRGGLLAVSVMLMFSLIAQCMRIRRFYPFFIAIFIVIGLPAAFFATGARSISDNSTSERLAILLRSIEYLEKFPSAFGHGFLHFNRVKLSHTIASNLVSHNTPIELIQNNGFLGGLVYLYFLILLFCRRQLDQVTIAFLIVSLFLALQSNLIFGLWFGYVLILLRQYHKPKLLLKNHLWEKKL